MNERDDRPPDDQPGPSDAPPPVDPPPVTEDPETDATTPSDSSAEGSESTKPVSDNDQQEPSVDPPPVDEQSSTSSDSVETPPPTQEIQPSAQETNPAGNGDPAADTSTVEDAQVRTSEGHDSAAPDAAAVKNQQGRTAENDAAEAGKATSFENPDAATAEDDDAAVRSLHEAKAKASEHVNYGDSRPDGTWSVKGGGHNFSNMEARCAAEGHKMTNLEMDPDTGVHQAWIERPNGDPVYKSFYPDTMSDADINAVGEQGLAQAKRGEASSYRAYGAELTNKGTPKQGYFQTTVEAPHGAPMEIAGWVRRDPISGEDYVYSHYPLWRR